MIGLCALVIMLIYSCGYYALYMPRNVTDKWIKFYQDGTQIKGITIDTDDGSGRMGEPDDKPGLVISKGISAISLSYKNKNGRILNIYFSEKRQYNYKLNAILYDGDYYWSMQDNEFSVNIREHSKNEYINICYDKISKTVEKNIYIEKNNIQTQWSGSSIELLKNGKWKFVHYDKGKATIAGENLTDDEKYKLRNGMKTPADKDYYEYVYEKIKIWQLEMTNQLHVPLLVDADYASLKKKYF